MPSTTLPNFQSLIHTMVTGILIVGAQLYVCTKGEWKVNIS